MKTLKKAAPKKQADCAVGVSFIAAIAILLMVAGYVIQRLSSDRAYREKWKDYNDCGWA